MNRSRLIQRLRARLVRDGYPRLQMSLIVLLTGGVGFLAASLLLKAGMDTMWLRYLCAFVVAYPAYLLLLWLWLRTRTEDYTDFPDVSNLVPSSSGSADPVLAVDPARWPVEGGGSFGGGGASGGFDAPLAGESISLDEGAAEGITDVAGDALGAAGDADEFAIVLLVVIMLLAVVASSVWVVYTAPGLFAELTVDGALSAGLYHRLRKAETRYWLETAVRRTLMPFILTTAVVVGCGWYLQKWVPTALSIGDVTAHLKHG
ncbi:MAG TPA: hypothetical protein PK437_12635 [Thiobacillaceae bacterium]|nr:hypothetical protein [Thiobacillaceae bacterium]